MCMCTHLEQACVCVHAHACAFGFFWDTSKQAHKQADKEVPIDRQTGKHAGRNTQTMPPHQPCVHANDASSPALRIQPRKHPLYHTPACSIQKARSSIQQSHFFTDMSRFFF